jgi:Ca2+:H+ antiporter
VVGTVRTLFFGTPKERPWTNVLLVFLPITVISYWTKWPDGLTFCLALVGLIPLAERLGFCTEAISVYTTDTLAGLINATLGNAPELLIAIFAVRSSSLRIVQISLFGSIISNLLLVLGVSLTVGGLKHHEQIFSTVNATNSVTLLLFSVFSHFFASVISEMHTGISNTAVLQMSRAFAVLGISSYIALLYYQLKTHAELFVDEESDNDEDERSVNSVHSQHEAAPVDSMIATVDVQPALSAAGPTVKAPLAASPTPIRGSLGSHDAVPAEADATEATALSTLAEEHKSEDDHEPKMSFWEALISLAAVAGVVAMMSEILTSSLKGAAVQFQISEGFVEAVLTPIAGNATEHFSAVYFALKNRLNVSFGIAVGSSVQISLFLIPFMCVGRIIAGYSLR